MGGWIDGYPGCAAPGAPNASNSWLVSSSGKIELSVLSLNFPVLPLISRLRIALRERVFNCYFEKKEGICVL